MDAARTGAAVMDADADAKATAAKTITANVAAARTATTDAGAATNSRYARSCRPRRGPQDLLTKTADAVIKIPCFCCWSFAS